MLGVSLIIMAAAIVYMVETYISTYYTIEYMHGTSLFLVLLAEYGTPVLFLLLCAYIAYRNFLKKQKAAASAASERPTSKEELYTNKIQTALKTKSVFSEQADQMLYQVRRFGQKMAVAYSMTQDSKTSGEQAKCLTLLESAERIFYDRLDDAIRSASMFDETEYKAFYEKALMPSVMFAIYIDGIYYANRGMYVDDATTINCEYSLNEEVLSHYDPNFVKGL